MLSNLQDRQSLLSRVLRWVVALQDKLCCWILRQWGFACPILTFLQRWTSLSQIPPKWGAPGVLIFQTIFFCNKSPSFLALTYSFMNIFSSLAAPTNLFPFHWWWCSGSHVLQRILSLQLDMTRCPMTVQLWCVLLSLLDKWRGSSIFSSYVVGTWIWRFLRWEQLLNPLRRKYPLQLQTDGCGGALNVPLFLFL